MTERKAVVYTDGGCRPNNGYGGSGFHGYLFDNEKPKKGTGLKGWSITPVGYIKHDEPLSDEDRTLIAQETGEDISSNGPPPNVKVLEYWNYSQGLPFPSTNNSAEAQSVATLLKLALEKELTSLRIFADSEYVINGVSEWSEKWATRGFTDRNGEPIANRNHWVSIVDSMKRLKAKGCTVTIEWVKAHNGHIGNEHADYQATLGVIASRKGHYDSELSVTPAEGYWTPKVDVHPMVTLPRWYFNTSVDIRPDEKGRYTYHFGTHGKDDDFVGKPVSDAAFGIVKIHETLPAFEAVRQYHNQVVENGLIRVAVARTDYINSPVINRLLSGYGSRYLTQENNKPDSYMYLPMAKKPVQVGRELSPAKTSYNLIDTMQALEEKLNAYEAGKDKGVEVTDITDLLYETISKSKGKTETKLLPTVTNVVKSLPIDVNHPINDTPFPIALTLGVDMPSRNELSRLAKTDPKVTVITWRESPYAFRAATVIETSLGIGIWSGFYANIHLVT